MMTNTKLTLQQRLHYAMNDDATRRDGWESHDQVNPPAFSLCEDDV